MKTIFALILLSTQAFGESSFNEVRRALLNRNPVAISPEAREEILVYQRGELPRYEVTTAKFIKNGVDVLAQAAKRTINEKKDLYPRIEKLLHSNGVCFTGVWSPVGNNPYTGLFEKGKDAFLVMRVSTALSGTRWSDRRGFGVVGKIFPTQNPNQRVKTAHFFTVDVLTGTNRPTFLGTTTTNNPPLGIVNPTLFKLVQMVKKSLESADRDLLYRPLYELGEAGKPPGKIARHPKFIKIKANGRFVNEDDFRDELNIQKHHREGLKFEMYGHETSNKPEAQGWVKLANMHLKESVVSYACDRQVHFAHPKLR